MVAIWADHAGLAGFARQYFEYLLKDSKKGVWMKWTINDEILFVGTAEAEHVEMYLKAIWHIKGKRRRCKD